METIIEELSGDLQTSADLQPTIRAPVVAIAETTLDADEQEFLFDFIAPSRLGSSSSTRHTLNEDKEKEPLAATPCRGSRVPYDSSRGSSRPTSSTSTSSSLTARPSSGATSRASHCTGHTDRFVTTITELERKLQEGITKHGLDNQNVLALAAELCKQYNSVSMQLIDRKDLDMAYMLLQKADILTESSTGVLSGDMELQHKLRAVTCNNLGCYFKHRGKPQAALHYLQQAHELEKSLPSCEQSASTLLNLCAALSSMKRHQQALHYAQQAVDYLLAQHHLEAQDVERPSSNIQQLYFPPVSLPRRSASLLATSYYNKAVELEHLACNQEALNAYRVAASLAKDSSKFAKSFQATYASFQKRVIALNKKANNRTPRQK